MEYRNPISEKDAAVSTPSEGPMESPRQNRFIMAGYVLLTALIASLATALVMRGEFEKQLDAQYGQYKPLIEMAETIEDKYYYMEDVQSQSGENHLVDGALRGMIGSIGDTYAAYYTEEQYQELMQTNSGEYKGLGIMVIVPDETGSAISKVYAGGPMEAQGVVPGDIILKVNGTDAANMEFEAFLALFSKDDAVPDVILLLHDGIEREITVYRSEIVVPRVSYELLPENVAYIRIEEFTGGVITELTDAVKEAQKDGAVGLLIDLRDNPGGGLTEVLGTVDLFLDKGDVITTLKSRSDNSIVYKAESDSELSLPVAVLVNGNSASASELFSGALQSHKRAVIIGTQTFGKGIVQSFYRLNSNSGWVKMTTEAYFTPSDVCIQGIGITPDIQIELPKELQGYYDIGEIEHDLDTQLQQGIAYLTATES